MIDEIHAFGQPASPKRVTVVSRRCLNCSFVSKGHSAAAALPDFQHLVPEGVGQPRPARHLADENRGRDDGSVLMAGQLRLQALGEMGHHVDGQDDALAGLALGDVEPAVAVLKAVEAQQIFLALAQPLVEHDGGADRVAAQRVGMVDENLDGFAPRIARRYTKPRGSPQLTTGTTSTVTIRGSILHADRGSFFDAD